ncbi:MAG: hypothetical protein Ct9H300mP18_04620 [Candidatus Neomarinimicrobiota bacterium]|nr:MAG: hypothetical protein Ct9H300mP18_04620 [Candidatus Neomarinimicrobiota bacterium]
MTIMFMLLTMAKYDIINIDDPSNPFRVGVFELDTPGHSIHDVWIENGIAYSSNWSDGVVAVELEGQNLMKLIGLNHSLTHCYQEQAKVVPQIQ